MPKTIIPLRGKIGSRHSKTQFRFVEKIMARPGINDGVDWVSCRKPTPMTMMTVVNAGTSFARVEPSTPQFSRSVKFSKPCTNKE